MIKFLIDRIEIFNYTLNSATTINYILICIQGGLYHE